MCFKCVFFNLKTVSSLIECWNRILIVRVPVVSTNSLSGQPEPVELRVEQVVLIFDPFHVYELIVSPASYLTDEQYTWSLLFVNHFLDLKPATITRNVANCNVHS